MDATRIMEDIFAERVSEIENNQEVFNSTYVERKCFLCGKKYQAEGITNWTTHVMTHTEQLKSYITLSVMRGDSRKEFWETYLGKLNYITLFGSSK